MSGTVLFWVFAAALLAAALWTLLRPILRGGERDGREEPDGALAVHRLRVVELEDDLALGSVDPAQEQAVRVELERDLLRAADRPASATAPSTGASRRRQAVAIGLILSVGVIALYLRLGHPDFARGQAAPTRDVAAARREAVEGMVGQLADRLKDHPDDRQGWEMLAQSYAALGRYVEAASAAEKLYALTGDEPDVLVRLADALARANGGRLTGRPAELLNRALALNPNHRGALWLAGAAAAESGDRAAAVAYWERLVPLMQDEPEVRARIQDVIEKTRQASAAAPVGGAPTPAPGAKAAVPVRVEVAPALAGSVSPDATLYIVAKTSGGSPMPIAVARRRAGELPLDLTLDDSMSIGGAGLSGGARVDLSARISKSGDAERRSGDLIGELRGVAVGETATSRIVIDTRIP